MADKKDLSEAQSYSRRRLVTAFTSGIPDGVELMPKKNQTPVIVGVGLTIIAMLISMFYGIISPSLPSGWENNKLIVAKGSAARCQLPRHAASRHQRHQRTIVDPLFRFQSAHRCR